LPPGDRKRVWQPIWAKGEGSSDIVSRTNWSKLIWQVEVGDPAIELRARYRYQLRSQLIGSRMSAKVSGSFPVVSCKSGRTKRL